MGPPARTGQFPRHALTRAALRGILTLGHVDDLAVCKAIRRAEALTVAGGCLAADFVRRDLRSLLDDDLLFAGGVPV